MIGSLRGVLLDRSSSEVLVEVAGVGYRVTVTPSTSVMLGSIGDEVFLHVHHHVREDAQTLYGFATRDERVVFEALLGAHGVGPSLALAILSVHTPAQLRAALASDDVAALCLVPGVGKKTAARLLVELKSRLELGEVVDVTALAEPGTNGAAAASPALADAREALANLGYGPDEIREALADLPPGDDAGELVREALKRLAVRA
ncbi:MAG TPA: Holliday junction branch migration protein RuvA [Acidimicrobiales bacterium]